MFLQGGEGAPSPGEAMQFAQFLSDSMIGIKKRLDELLDAGVSITKPAPDAGTKRRFCGSPRPIRSGVFRPRSVNGSTERVTELATDAPSRIQARQAAMPQ
jgi:hypothetical protein